jgi:hypothetical protein
VAAAGVPRRLPVEELSMPIVMTWGSPGSLTRSGGCGYNNGDFVVQPITAQTLVTINLAITTPSSGVSGSSPPVVTITPLPDGTSHGSPSDIQWTNTQLTFSIGNNAVEKPGYLHQLDITISGNESYEFQTVHLLAATPCTLRVYYVFSPPVGTTTSAMMAVRKGAGYAGTTTTTTKAPVLPPVRKKAKGK